MKHKGFYNIHLMYKVGANNSEDMLYLVSKMYGATFKALKIIKYILQLALI